MLSRFHGQQDAPVGKEFARKHASTARRIMGWVRTELGLPVGELSLKVLYKDSSASSVELALKHLEWLRTERRASAGHGMQVARTLMQACLTPCTAVHGYPLAGSAPPLRPPNLSIPLS
jgi:hypothetical protein